MKIVAKPTTPMSLAARCLATTALEASWSARDNNRPPVVQPMPARIRWLSPERCSEDSAGGADGGAPTKSRMPLAWPVGRRPYRRREQSALRSLLGRSKTIIADDGYHAG